MKITLLILAFLALSAEAQRSRREIRWKPMRGADKFELQITKNRKTVARKTYPGTKTKWVGRLKPGIYLYRLRAIDRAKRPGAWSKPHAFYVEPLAPTLKAPKKDEKFKAETEEVELTWNSVKGIEKYRLTVLRDGEEILSKEVEDTKYELEEIKSGSYQWSVRSIFVAEEKLPKGFKNTIDSFPSKEGTFVVDTPVLAKPNLVGPFGRVEVAEGEKIELSWEEVPGALSYEIRVREKVWGERALASPTKVKRYRTKRTSIRIPVKMLSRYQWAVRAVAKVEGKKKKVRGPASRKSFQVVNKPSALAALEVGVAGGVNWYGYSSVEQNGPASANIPSERSSLLNLRGKYWFNEKWGVGIGALANIFQVTDVVFERSKFDLFLAGRFFLKSVPRDWAVHWNVGLQTMDYFDLRPNGNTSSVDQFGALGPALGLQLKKRLGASFDVTAGVEVFLPIAVLGTDAGSVVLIEGLFDNAHLNLTGTYWVDKKWAISVGGQVAFQGMGLQKPGQNEIRLRLTSFGPSLGVTYTGF